MKRIVLFSIFWAVVFVPIICFANESGKESSLIPIPEEDAVFNEIRKSEEMIEKSIFRIDTIEVCVLSSMVRIGQNNPEAYKTYPAATASRGKRTNALPFNKIGYIWKITLNPAWYPPNSIRGEEFRKTGKWLPKRISPGKRNPLGKIKLFISYDGANSTLGIHNTNAPESIGRRVSHGCTRLGDDIFEITRIILMQNGFDADALFAQAAKNPGKSIELLLQDKPSVVYLKK